MINRTLRRLGLAAALPLSLSACSTGTKPGDTEVESSSAKKLLNNRPPAHANGDSLAAGLHRDTVHRPTGKDLYKAAGQARDRNHDGIAD